MTDKLSEEQENQLWRIMREYAEEFSTLTPEEREQQKSDTLKRHPIAYMAPTGQKLTPEQLDELGKCSDPPKKYPVN